VLGLANAICNDMFITYLPMLYPVQTIALAGIMMSAARYKHPLPSSDAVFTFEKTFSLFQRRNPKCDKADFENLHWAKKIDERINEVHLFECIKKMTEFYQKLEDSNYIKN
jgi:hypothetical protein